MLNDHRTLKAEEALALYIIGTHTGESAMTIAQVREKLLPHPLEIQFIQDQGYIREGQTSRGRPLVGSCILTEHGREALRRHAGSALAELNGRIKKATIEPERVRLTDLQDRMKDMLDDLRERSRDGEADRPRPAPPASKRPARRDR